ncbi:MAG: DUF1343 domain-containing protein [Acidobacteriota bacterium]
MIRTGLDRLLRNPAPLAGRRYALLAHGASIARTSGYRNSRAGLSFEPIHLALRETGHLPTVIFGPEHGFYGVEQDMVASSDGVDPWTGVPILSLYGDDESSLRPKSEVFDGLDLLIIDLQDVGSRYYTYAATAVWAAAAAAARGLEIWVLDRPNPLGGDIIEGNLPEPGFESFVGAFRIPVRHGLTLGELMRLEAKREGFDEALTVLPMDGWRRSMGWRGTGLPWVAPSPNMPTLTIARLYPGGCLVEATELSEGRGTTRPFQLVGSPDLDPLHLVAELDRRQLPGVSFVPTFFKPQFQKHAGRACGGVEILVTDHRIFLPYRTGVELLAAVQSAGAGQLQWRQEPYEFVIDRPALDLLTGTTRCREAIESGEGLEAWIASWEEDEESFRELRRPVLIYGEDD